MYESALGSRADFGADLIDEDFSVELVKPATKQPQPKPQEALEQDDIEDEDDENFSIDLVQAPASSTMIYDLFQGRFVENVGRDCRLLVDVGSGKTIQAKPVSQIFINENVLNFQQLLLLGLYFVLNIFFTH